MDVRRLAIGSDRPSQTDPVFYASCGEIPGRVLAVPVGVCSTRRTSYQVKDDFSSQRELLNGAPGRTRWKPMGIVLQKAAMEIAVIWLVRSNQRSRVGQGLVIALGGVA